MSWYYTPYLLPMLAAALISTVLAIYAWRRRGVPGATAFFILAIALIMWSLGYALEIAGTDLTTKIFWGKVQYIGIIIVTLAWLAFSLQYTNHIEWLTRRNLTLLAILPLITLTLVWTNEAHHFIWKSYNLAINGPFLALEVQHGFWFWIHSAYSYLLLLAGSILLVKMLIDFPHRYRQQAGFLLLGTLMPWAGNGLYLLGLVPIPNFDLTPLAFTLTGVLWWWSLWQLRLLELVPVARRAVVDSMKDGVLVLDVQHRIVDLNPAAQQIMGCTPAQALGKTPEQFLPTWPNLRDVLHVETEISFNNDSISRDLELTISPLYTRPNQLQGRLIVLRDITARKQAEEALRVMATENLRLARAIAAASDGIVITDPHRPDNPIIYANPAFERITGYELKEVFGRNCRFLQGPDTDPEAIAQIRQAIAVPQEVRVVLLNYKKNGQTFWNELKISPVISGQGFLLYFIGIQTDITQRKQAEEALQDSEARYRMLAENANDLIARHAPDGTCLYLSPACRTLLGYEPDEMLGRSPYEIFHPADIDHIESAFAGLLTTADTYISSYRIRRKDGHYIWFETSVRAIRHPETDEVQEIIAISRDITGRKRSEEAIALARDEALAASNLKSQLLANVSHDVRTPLSGILGYAEMLQEGVFDPLTDDQREATKEIVDSARQLLGLINSLLDQARIEAGKLALDIGPFAPQDLIETMYTSLGQLAQRKQLTLTSQISAEMPITLIGDRERIQQILFNLVSNALKFTERGTVAVSFYPTNAAHWAIEVADTGPGIPTEAQIYIFEAFRQVDGSVTRRHGGVGLGLSIVKQLVDLMGGQISLESTEGQGSIFTVLLPLQIPQDSLTTDGYHNSP